MSDVCTLPSMTYVQPDFDNLEDKLEEKRVENEGVIVYIVAAVILLGFGYAAYCTFKGGSFEWAFKINPFEFKIACEM